MKNCALCRVSSDVIDKIADTVFAKQRKEEKKKAWIIAIICASAALVIGAAVAVVVYLTKKQDDEKGIKVLLGNFKNKFKKAEDNACDACDALSCEDCDVAAEEIVIEDAAEDTVEE